MLAPVVYVHLAMVTRNTGSNATSTMISLRLPRTTLENLKAVAAGEGVGYQKVLKRFIDEGLNGTPKPPESVVKAVRAASDKRERARIAAILLLPKKPRKPRAPALVGGLTDEDLDDMMDGLDED